MAALQFSMSFLVAREEKAAMHAISKSASRGYSGCSGLARSNLARLHERKTSQTWS